MKKKLKIAFPFIGGTIGGSHISTFLLMSALQAEGHEVIAVLHQGGLLPSILAKRGIPFIILDFNYVKIGGGPKFLLELSSSILPISNFLRKNRFDLVHANDGRMINTWIPAAKCARVACIAHRRTKWAPSRLSDWCHRLADKIVVISEYVRQSAPEKLREQMVVILNPFEEPIQANYSSDSNALNFLFVGTLQAQKRPLDFIQCAALIRKEVPAARFHMVGRLQDAHADVIKLITTLGLSDYVTLYGFQENIQTYYDDAAILLAPAINEGHGRSLIEAMFNRVLVIAADSGGHREIIAHKKNGLLSPEGDAIRMAELSIEAVNSQSTRNQLITNAFADVAERFSVQAHCCKMIQVYDEVTKKIG